MCSTGFLPDPANQGKDNQGRVEDEEKDVQEVIHQWGIAGSGQGSRFIRRSRSWKRGSLFSFIFDHPSYLGGVSGGWLQLDGLF